MTRTYHSDLRARRAELTRERILRATQALLHTRRPADLAWPIREARIGCWYL